MKCFPIRLFIFFQIRNLQSEVEKKHLVEKQLNEKNGELETLLATAHEQIEQTKAKLNETCSDELAHLYSEVSTLQSDNVSIYFKTQLTTCVDWGIRGLLYICSLNIQLHAAVCSYLHFVTGSQNKN